MSTVEIELNTKDSKPDVRFKQILVATDFSASSRRALQYAAALAHRYASRIALVHALPPDPHEPAPIYPLPRELDRERSEAERRLKETIVDLNPDLKPDLVLRRGLVWDVLDCAIHDEKADLLVVGTHGRGGLKKLALGSVAEQAVRRAECPVLTVGPNVPLAGSHPANFKRILFATDFGPSSIAAWPYAFALAEDYGAKLVLLHMLPPISVPDIGPAAFCPGTFICDDLVEWQKEVRLESEKKLQALLPPHNRLTPLPECVVGSSFLPEGILEVAATRNIDLIVMGANRTHAPRMMSHIPSAMVPEVLGRAQCPVLTVNH